MQTEMEQNQQHRILVVDDEFGPRESLRLILTPMYNVAVACNGLEALNLFERELPDMIISDIRMPQMDGIQLLKEVKKRDADIPFILLTGYATLESAQEAVRTGAFDYISKPYNVNEIRSVVKSAFESLQKQNEMSQTLIRLEESNQQLENRIRKLDLKASLGDLSAEVIHDLNNPICALQGYVDLLEDTLAEQPGFNASEQKEFLDIIRRQAERCIQLTQNFLNYARPSTNQWEKANVNNVISDIVQMFQARLRAHRIQLELDLSKEIPDSCLEPKPLQQVFYNMIVNAIHAMEDSSSRGRLAIKTRILKEEAGNELEEQIEISISDNGEGMPEDVKEKIFTRFFTTKGPERGTGLGLAICKRIIDEHCGIIEVESKVGFGTTFKIKLPIFKNIPFQASINEQKVG